MGRDWQRDKASCAHPCKVRSELSLALQPALQPAFPPQPGWHRAHDGPSEPAVGQLTPCKQFWPCNGKKTRKRAQGEGGNGGYLPGHPLRGPQGDDPPSSALRLSTFIPATPLAQGYDSPCAPGAGLAGGWQVPTGLRASPRLHASMVIPAAQSRHQAGKHPARKSAFPSPRRRAGSSTAQRFRQYVFFFYRKKLLLDPGLRFLATSRLSLKSSRFLKCHIFLL